MKKRFVVFSLLSLLVVQIFAAGVLVHPRKINLLKTRHFDILYPDESSHLAAFIATKGEDFFVQAQCSLETENNFRMPVVISPDSEISSVYYSASPYRRLVVFDGVFTQNQLVTEETFASMLYREIYLAVAQSVMSPINQIIRDTIGGEEYSPISMFNLPVSLIEGYGYIVQTQNDYTKINDGYYLRLLAEAKLEGKVPSWFQTFAKRDIYPGDDLAAAAGTAFTAYLMQAYGVEKYAEFWAECGNLHPFFAAGIIKKVYGKAMKNLWKDFVAQIPLPESLEQMKALEQEITTLLTQNENIYSNLVYSDYGLIWYDEFRHEVDLYDLSNNSFFDKGQKTPKRLFSAEGIKRLSVSPDGRYLVLSFIQTKRELEKNITWLYDLEEKKYLDDVFYLREASIVTLANGTNAVAGINVEQQIPKLQIYTSKDLGSEKKELIYEKVFEKETIPAVPVYGGNGKILYTIATAGRRTLQLLEIETGISKAFAITDLANNEIRVSNLSYQNVASQMNGQDLYTFQYVNVEEKSFTRFGSFILDEDEPTAVSLQDGDIAGGVFNPIIFDNHLIFTSHKINFDDLKYLPTENVPLQPGQVISLQEDFEPPVEVPEYDLSDYKISKYSLLTYWHRFSVAPFLPIQNISYEEGADTVPGLGLQVKLVPDPLMNNKISASLAWSYLNLDYVWMLNTPTDEQKIINYDRNKKSKDKTAAIFMENTSTPMAIKAGALVRTDFDGEYDFEFLSGVSWEIPLGFTFNKLDFDAYLSYAVSTDYYDANLADIYPTMKNAPALWNAYELLNFSISAQFKNIRQFGSSPYEQRGVLFGFNTYTVWDIYKYKLLSETKDENAANSGTGTAAQNASQYTQIFFNIFGTIALPKVLPIKSNYDGWIVGLPTTASVSFASRAGVFFDSNVETLLIGKEVQNGFSFMNFYCNRVGLKLGMDYMVKYDTESTELPDFRYFDYIQHIIDNSKTTVDYYLLLNLDFVLPIGPLSQQVVSSAFKTTYYPDTSGFTFSLDFNVKF